MSDINLWSAIYALYSLLEQRMNDENIYQEYFEKNPIVFSVLGYTSSASFEKSSSFSLPFDKERNYTPEPDFICARKESGEVTIFN
jgi:hypothetical protein